MFENLISLDPNFFVFDYKEKIEKTNVCYGRKAKRLMFKNLGFLYLSFCYLTINENRKMGV